MKKLKEIKDKKLNTRLYPIYKMLSWDLLFYFSIIYLFLTQTKGFSPSQVLITEAFFTAARLLLQIPLGFLIDKIGKKNSVVFANICLSVFTFILLIVNNYGILLIGFFIYAIGYVIKGICDANILYDSLPRGKKRGSLYSKVDGIATSRFYIVDAITSLVTGFAYVVNPYLPIVLSFIASVVATILATRFKHTNISKEDDEKNSGREYLEELKDAFKFSFTSKRMFCLLMFFALVGGVNYNLATFRSGILDQIELPEQYFGIVFAMVQMAASLCSGLQGKLHKKFRNRTLSVIGIPMTSFCIIIGLLAMGAGNVGIIKKGIIIWLFVILGGVKGAHNVLTYRYLNNFTNKKIRTKLANVRDIVYSIFSIIISLFGSWLLNITSVSNALLVVGIISTIGLIVLLYYMKDKVGLKPEEYDELDLKYSNLNIKK